MAFFDPSDAGLTPHPGARAPWSADMLHGRLLAGLAAWAIERDHGDDGFVPARLTVDLFKAPAMALTTIETTLVRAGGRVRVVDAQIAVGGEDVARASSLWLRRSAATETDPGIPRTAAWDAPPPAEDGESPYADEAFDVRVVGEGGIGAAGPDPRRVWLRDRRPLVEGEVFTPFVRAALCADYVNPLANSGPAGIDYINADLTLHLGRLPAGDWIGVETNDRVAADGVTVVECRYFDERGPIGFSAACAVRTPRLPLDQ